MSKRIVNGVEVPNYREGTATDRAFAAFCEAKGEESVSSICERLGLNRSSVARAASRDGWENIWGSAAKVEEAEVEVIEAESAVLEEHKQNLRGVLSARKEAISRLTQIADDQRNAKLDSALMIAQAFDQKLKDAVQFDDAGNIIDFKSIVVGMDKEGDEIYGEISIRDLALLQKSLMDSWNLVADLTKEKQRDRLDLEAAKKAPVVAIGLGLNLGPSPEPGAPGTLLPGVSLEDWKRSLESQEKDEHGF